MCDKHLRNMHLPTSKKELSYTVLICNFQALSLRHQQRPGNPAAGKQASFFSHNPCHSPCTTYQPLIQRKTPCPICHTPPLATPMACFCMWLYSSIAKPPRKCLLCVGELCLGSLSPDSLPSRVWSWVPLLTPMSSALWYSFSNDREILLFLISFLYNFT